jgi:hypothetical protein
VLHVEAFDGVGYKSPVFGSLTVKKVGITRKYRRITATSLARRPHNAIYIPAHVRHSTWWSGFNLSWKFWVGITAKTKKTLSQKIAKSTQKAREKE